MRRLLNKRPQFQEDEFYMSKLILKGQKSEERIQFSATVAHIQGQTTTRRTGTCFAGKGEVCNKTLTPNIKKADRLRSQKYW